MFPVFYTGWGIVAFIIPLLVWGLFQVGTGLISADFDYWRNHTWPRFAALLVSGERPHRAGTLLE